MALTARAARQSEDYASVAISEDNFPMLDVYLSSAVANAEGELRKKLSGSNGLDLKISGTSVDISLREQTRQDLSVLNLIGSSIRLYMAYYVAAEWLRTTVAAALCEVYGATAVTHLNNAIGGLSQKEFPTIGDADYSDRSDQGNVRLTEAGNWPADYSSRKGDNVLARPGKITRGMEVIVLHGEEGCINTPAISSNSELLISKP